MRYSLGYKTVNPMDNLMSVITIASTIGLLMIFVKILDKLTKATSLFNKPWIIKLV